MFGTKFRYIILNKTSVNNSYQHKCLLHSQFLFKTPTWWNNFWCIFKTVDYYSMSSRSKLKILLRNVSVSKLWSVWSRSHILNGVKKFKKDIAIRGMFQCFRNTLLRPKRILMLSATAAYKNNNDDSSVPCEKNITDEDMEALLHELENVVRLTTLSLVCKNCHKRLPIDTKQPGIDYCVCNNSQPTERSPDGWVPYMEEEGVIIWRKEYKPGQGLYAYKVYGRYGEVVSGDFAAIQIDGAYRRVWDDAVASLAVVEKDSNGVRDQAVLHWEVLWPRLFANRDYVFIRRHKEYTVTDYQIRSDQKNPIVSGNTEFPSSNVTSTVKRADMQGLDNGLKNKIYVILSRSCKHPEVPETKRAIRVTEYWSHMVIKSLNGENKPGMEYVLIYYDEPARGAGLPGGVTAWVSGRAAPAFLARMRRAAMTYRRWVEERGGQDTPDFTPFIPDQVSQHNFELPINEEDMESSKQGPDMGNLSNVKNDGKNQMFETTKKDTVDDKKINNAKQGSNQETTEEAKSSEEQSDNSNAWWKHPLYYFI